MSSHPSRTGVVVLVVAIAMVLGAMVGAARGVRRSILAGWNVGSENSISIPVSVRDSDRAAAAQVGLATGDSVVITVWIWKAQLRTDPTIELVAADVGIVPTWSSPGVAERVGMQFFLDDPGRRAHYLGAAAAQIETAVAAHGWPNYQAQWGYISSRASAKAIAPGWVVADACLFSTPAGLAALILTLVFLDLRRAARLRRGLCPLCAFKWDQFLCTECGYKNRRPAKPPKTNNP